MTKIIVRVDWYDEEPCSPDRLAALSTPAVRVTLNAAKSGGSHGSVVDVEGEYGDVEAWLLANYDGDPEVVFDLLNDSRVDVQPGSALTYEAHAEFWSAVEDASDGRRFGTVSDDEALTEVLAAAAKLEAFRATVVRP